MFNKIYNQILIADPFKNAADGLTMFISSFHDPNAVERVDSVRTLSKKAKEINPRIVFVDPYMFDGKMKDAINCLKCLFPTAKIIVLGVFLHEEYEAMSLGADGFVDKLTPTASEQIFNELFRLGFIKNRNTNFHYENQPITTSQLPKLLPIRQTQFAMA